MDTGLYVGAVGLLSTLMFTSAGEAPVMGAENVRWLSFNFKTVLTWTPRPTDYTYTVQYSKLDEDWRMSLDCIRITDTECDLTNQFTPLDRNYSADIQSEPSDGMIFDLEEYPHTLAPTFNPYKESNISAVTFTLAMGEDLSSVTVNITDPLTPLYRGPNLFPEPSHLQGTLLSVRDILRKDLKYIISYYKAGRTGKKEEIHDSNIAEIIDLESGGSYCFNVRAFIPSRRKASQLGAWSQRQCTPAANKTLLQEWSTGAQVGICILLLLVIIVIIIVCALCCKHCRRTRTKTTQRPPPA